MFFIAKEGDILAKPIEINDAKVLIGYEKEGGSPLFVVLEHNGKVSLAAHGEENFEEILNLVL